MSKRYTVAGWRIERSAPCVLGGWSGWRAFREGRWSRYYNRLAEARRAAAEAGETKELEGGFGII